MQIDFILQFILRFIVNHDGILIYLSQIATSVFFTYYQNYTLWNLKSILLIIIYGNIFLSHGQKSFEVVRRRCFLSPGS